MKPDRVKNLRWQLLNLCRARLQPCRKVSGIIAALAAALSEIELAHLLFSLQSLRTQTASKLAIARGMGKDGLFVPAPQEACLPLERLDRDEAKVLLIWICAGILGAGVAYTYFFRAFPEASVEFKVPRADALAVAKQFAAAQGAQLGEYDSSIVFDLDDTAKTYLEREVGLQQANQMMANEVHIWYWRTRFFRPLQKEEFDVRVDPGGGIVGYRHEVEEAAS